MNAAATPTLRRRLAVAAHGLWGISFGVLRDFVWSDLRDGLIDVRGLPAATRALVWFAAILLAATIGVLLFDEVWRAQSTLVPTPRGASGRGSLVPIALIPATLALFAVAWSLILAGALHAGAWVRLGVLALYLLTIGNWAELPEIEGWDSLATAPGVWVSVAGIVAVPLIFALSRRARWWSSLEFMVLLLAVTATLAPAQTRNLENWRVTGIPLMMARLEGDVTSIRLLVMPLLLLIGIDVAGFTRLAAGWATDAAASRLPRWAPWALLPPLIGWRAWDVIGDAISRIEDVSPGPALLAYAGALLGALGAWLAWWSVAELARRRAGADAGHLTRRRAGADAGHEASTAHPGPDAVARAAETHALPLVVAYTGYGLVVFVSGGLTSTLTALGFIGAGQSLIQLTAALNQVSGPWFLVVDVAALALGAWLAWQGRRAPAVYLVTFAILRLWWEATRPGRPLGMLDPLGWSGVDAWWVVIAVGVTLGWLARGRLTRDRALAVVSVLLVTALLRQTDFIENKFSPLFGWAGVGFIAFGLAWDALTKGAWTNRGTPGLPRAARILLYLGYALLTATVVNWFLATHDLFSLRFFTGGGALLGFAAFGRPMLYAALAAALAAPPREQASARLEASRPSP